MATPLDLANWQAHVDRDIPINRVHIPGTHDSGAYTLDFTQTCGQTRWIKGTAFLARWIPFAKTVCTAWSQTQDYTLYDQMKRGVRSFDLRVSHNASVNDYFLTHTYTCALLCTALNDVRRFLDEHPTEVVLISVKPDWEHRQDITPKRVLEIFDRFTHVFGDLVCPPPLAGEVYDDTMTLNAMALRNRRVVIYSAWASAESWTLSKVNLPWNNTDDINEKKRMMVHDSVNFVASPTNLNGVLFTLTAKDGDWWNDMLSRLFKVGYQPRSIRSMNEKVLAIMPWYIKTFPGVVPKLSLMVTDFPTRQFVESVIRLNQVPEVQVAPVEAEATAPPPAFAAVREFASRWWPVQKAE